MALVLIGYDPDRAGLVGTAWGTNTVNLATQKSLFDNYTVSITAGSPRQFAAQLLYNTLWACTVRWSDDANGYEDVTTSNGTNDGVTAGLLNVTVAKKYMSLDEVTGIYGGDNKIFTGLRDTESRVYVNGNAKTITFVPEEGNSLVGEAVRVLYKEHKDGSEGLDRKDTIYGITLTDDTTVVKATLGDIEDDKNGKIVIDGTSYDVYNNGIDVIVNFADETHYANAQAFTDGVKGTAGMKQDSADEIKLIMDDSGDAYVAYVTKVEFRKVTGLTSSKITLAGVGALDIDDSMDLDDSVAKDDIVAVTTLYAADPQSDDAYNVITKADVVEDVTVSDMKSSTEVKIDGSYAKYAARNDFVTTYDSNYANSVELDSTYNFIMYNGYWVAAEKISASSKDIALVTKTAPGINDQVKVMLSDGSEATYNLDDDDGAASDLKDAQAHKLYSYSLVGDNGIQLKNDQISGQSVTGLDFNVATGEASYNKDNKTISVDGKTYVTADEAVAFIYVKNTEDDDNYAYQIDSLKSFDKAQNVEYVLNDDKEVVAFYAQLTSKPGATASNDEYGYVVDDVRSTSIDGNKYWEISVWNGTETVDIRVEGSSAKDGVKKGAFIKYAMSGEGTAEAGDIAVLTEGNVGIVGNYRADRQLLTLIDKDGNTLNTYAVADDVAIIGVNTEDKELVEGIGDPIPSIKDEKTNEYPNNILYVLNTDKEVVAIFVDSENVITDDNVIPNGSAIVEK